MKTLISTLVLAVTLTAGHAQEQSTKVTNPPAKAQKTPPSPEQMSTRESERMAKELGLNDDQKTKVKNYAFERITANQAIREKMKSMPDGPDKKALHKQTKGNKDKFMTNVNSVLTPEQQTKWKQLIEERKQKHKGKELMEEDETPPSPPAGQ